MVRGIKTFVCKDCGHKLIGLDIEGNATINSMPVKCPKCGSWHTKSGVYPTWLIGEIIRLLRGKKFM